MHKYERDSAAAGKSSFAYAWVLDENPEERARGVTMDVGVNYFETDCVRFTLLDAPGRRDFIPRMINGATQADCGTCCHNLHVTVNFILNVLMFRRSVGGQHNGRRI